MKRIFMRSAMPFSGIDNISQILINNNIGENTGNLLYQNSIARFIMTEDTEITTFYARRKFTDEEIEKINQTYDIIVIPLANAFREDFVYELTCLTNLVRKAKIPSVVVGVGIQTKYNSNEFDFSFDSEVKEFVSAILEKSSMLGLRGEVTAEYLKRKGFIPEKDFTVIGCPSMYTYCDNLPTVKKSILTYDSEVAFSYRYDLDKKVYDYLDSEASKFSNLTTVTQIMQEIKNLYISYPYPEEAVHSEGFPQNYPVHINNPRMVSGKYIGFLDVPSWIDYLGQKDFTFGSRIHGIVASLLAGVPAYIISDDARVSELAAYHHIPHTNYTELDCSRSIIDYYEKADFDYMYAGHKERVTHFIDFLNKNRIETVSRDILNTENAPYDSAVSDRPKLGPVYPLSTVDIYEQERRTKEYIDVYIEKGKELNAVKKELYKTKKELNAVKTRKLYRLISSFDKIIKVFLFKGKEKKQEI